MPNVRILRIRARVARCCATRRRVKRGIVDASIGGEDEIRRQITILRFDNHQRGSSVGACRRWRNLPPLEVTRYSTEDDLAGLKLDDAGAKPRTRYSRLRVSERKRDEVSLG